MNERLDIAARFMAADLTDYRLTKIGPELLQNIVDASLWAADRLIENELRTRKRGAVPDVPDTPPGQPIDEG